MKKDFNTEQKIKNTINRRFYSIERAYQAFRNNPYSNDYVHRFRVELRKLRAILSFLKPIINTRKYDSINQELKELGYKLSKKRDLDTLIETLENTAEKEPLLISNYVDIFGYLEKERLEEGYRISGQESIQSFDTSLLVIKDMLNELEFKLDKKKFASLEVFITNRFKKKGKNLKKAYKKIDLMDYSVVHELRKDAKKVRYAAVGFKSILPRKIKQEVKKEAKMIQENLGSRTDNFVIISLLKEYHEKTTNVVVQASLQKLIAYYLGFPKN